MAGKIVPHKQMTGHLDQVDECSILLGRCAAVLRVCKTAADRGLITQIGSGKSTAGEVAPAVALAARLASKSRDAVRDLVPSALPHLDSALGSLGSLGRCMSVGQTFSDDVTIWCLDAVCAEIESAAQVVQASSRP